MERVALQPELKEYLVRTAFGGVTMGGAALLGSFPVLLWRAGGHVSQAWPEVAVWTGLAGGVGLVLAARRYGGRAGLLTRVVVRWQALPVLWPTPVVWAAALLWSVPWAVWCAWKGRPSDGLYPFLGRCYGAGAECLVVTYWLARWGDVPREDARLWAVLCWLLGIGVGVWSALGWLSCLGLACMLLLYGVIAYGLGLLVGLVATGLGLHLSGPVLLVLCLAPVHAALLGAYSGRTQGVDARASVE